MAVFGAFARLTNAKLLPLKEAPALSQSRTAILMPVYNEDVARVFSGVQAIFDSVAATGGFDFFILSDSTDPPNWIAEEVAWQKLRASLEPDARLFYRHRHRNIGRKSGNIQDFCENWGSHYDYMVVLDADSLMSGETLAALVRLMDANPRAALIQAPATLVGRSTLFARIQQFASTAYGPTYTAGLAWLQGGQGNYWGHNAIIRVRAFHAAWRTAASLPGKPPFGGEIMSHDFVEAAFLLRAGWEVWMAPDLTGSYEEPPPTVYDHLKRDRRWAQGNLQHSRVLLAQGLNLALAAASGDGDHVAISPRRSGSCCWWSPRWRCSCRRASRPSPMRGVIPNWRCRCPRRRRCCSWSPPPWCCCTARNCWR